MQTLLTFLNKPAVTLGEACTLVGANPRRATVWLQRSDNLPVPTGVRISERRRLFTGLEVTQLGVLVRLVDLGHDVGPAAIVADAAVQKLKTIDLLGATSLPQVIDRLLDLGLFVRPAGNSEVAPGKVVPRLEPIGAGAMAAAELVRAGRAPESYTLVPIGALAAAIIDQFQRAGV